jgi:hypothetical protein
LKRTQSEIVKPTVEEKDNARTNLKKKVDAANLQTEAEITVYGVKALSAQK